MRETIAESMVWGLFALLGALPIFFGWVWWDSRRRLARGQAQRLSSGGLAGFDEVWRPSAAVAHAVWEAEQITPAPSPIPGDGVGVIDGERIVIETGLRRHRTDEPA